MVTGDTAYKTGVLYIDTSSGNPRLFYWDGGQYDLTPTVENYIDDNTNTAHVPTIGLMQNYVSDRIQDVTSSVNGSALVEVYNDADNAGTIITKTGGNLTKRVPIKGAVINPTYDESTGLLKLKTLTGEYTGTESASTELSVDLGASFDKNAKEKLYEKASTSEYPRKSKFVASIESNASGKIQIFKDNLAASGTSWDRSTRELDATIPIKGAVVDPTYDPTTRKITLPIMQSTGNVTNLEINLGKDLVVQSGVYDSNTKNLNLTLTSGDVVSIPVGELCDVYTGINTSTITLTVDSEKQITAEVKLESGTDQLLSIGGNGLKVSYTAVKTKIKTDLIGNIGTSNTVKDYIDNRVSASGVTFVNFGA